MVADNPREPYEKVVKGGLKEIMSDFDEKELMIKQRENKKKRTDGYLLEKGTEEIGKKKNVIPWVVGISLLFAIPLYFIVKEVVTTD